MPEVYKTKKLDEKVVRILSRGGVGVLLTDTIYGLVGRANSRHAVNRIYKLKKRNPDKPFIILISGYSDLKKFATRSSTAVNKYWPGKVSIILDVPKGRTEYLHRGTATLAFRMPRSAKLRAFLSKTGPLAAPSANPEGKKPAADIREAEKYFGNKVDFYMDGGRRPGKPSKLIRIRNGSVEILRK